ncbi:hypothetical protein BCT86_01990 [Vibrio breoganii]|uniref:Winged helix-turn-helix domain-containing protein n=2 Tax=Vibrio TaxID=662 RepID=A0AAN0XXK7_9VIBR|nr:crosslink repair DNA glycosylase YcaQ family protein [Vibrio breoganii]ANO34500.1 hypothetical protein A6E01_14960 [Vibrio breoganii]PMG84536.1 hypothetical protein BCU83_04520 [Vibrio breoganii]PMG87489.1 hypothetical protein BCU81_00960 [Vibrio breoganii]PMK42545.1 hypothetical protein BCU00_12665 [Vibrio breoganii]PML04490.1 hypothetical protein BCT86_01990 [Vibrio breoganii]
MIHLSQSEAQKLALLSQGLCSATPKGVVATNVLGSIQQIGYVQIDTISVVQRAHHHVLWNRNAKYQPTHLDQLVASKALFEYWSHAASYLPMKNFRYTLPRKHTFRSGQQKHWYKKDEALMRSVLDKIKAEGPLMAKDFESKVLKRTGWESKPTKQALELLYMQGDLMIAERRNFHKVYDLTERVLPDDLDTTMPTETEYGEFLVLNYLKAHGIGTLSEMSYLLKGSKALIQQSLNELLESKQIEQVSVANQQFYTTTSSLELLNKRLARNRVHLLSPFDNVLIQRKRISQLFDFDYQLECYVPAAKRKFGYFCLPIAWDGKLIGRADCRVEKSTSTLQVTNLYIEKAFTHRDGFDGALAKELHAFATFNQCTSYQILSCSTLDN